MQRKELRELASWLGAALTRQRNRHKEARLSRVLCAPQLYTHAVGRDEAVVREHIENHDAEDNPLEQLNLWR